MFLRNRLLARRTVLRGAGVGVALPLLDAMVTTTGMLPGARRALGAPANPKRLILFFTGNGFTMSNWRPADTATFKLGPVMSPLEPIRQDLIQMDGLPYNVVFDSESRARSHPGGSIACFTGSYAGPGSQYNGTKGSTGGPPPFPSIDHLAGQTLGKDTKFPTYHFGVVPSTSGIFHRCFYGPNSTIINPNGDPQLAFEQLFAGVRPAGGAAPAGPDPATQARMQQRRGVLNLVMDDYRQLRCKLGADDRAKLDRHASNIAEVERRLGLEGNARVSAICAPPTLGNRVDPNRFENMPMVGPLQIELAAMALECDLVRVIGFQWHCNDSEGRGIYRWLGDGNDISHHDITHLRGSNPEVAKTSIGQYHAQQVLSLVTRLKGAREGTGSVMDSSVLLWGTDIANDRGKHDNRNAGYTLIGRAGGVFKTGRYVKFPGGDAYSNNRLLLSVLQAVGSPVTKVGVNGYSDGGPLPGLTG